jgi:hypothetical protein
MRFAAGGAPVAVKRRAVNQSTKLKQLSVVWKKHIFSPAGCYGKQNKSQSENYSNRWLHAHNYFLRTFPFSHPLHLFLSERHLIFLPEEQN